MPRSLPPSGLPPGFRLTTPQGAVLPAVAVPASRPRPAARTRPEPLWLAVHLPAFACEVGLAGLAPDTPAVLVTAAARHPQVLLPNVAAARTGILPGASLAMALALAGPALVVRTHDVLTEAGVLATLGDLSWRWTPVVGLAPPDGLLLEVAGSLGLFGGIEALCAAVRRAFGTAGHAVVLASAPSAQGALLLALAGMEARVTGPAELSSALRRLPLASLRVPARADRLEGMGLRHFGQLLRLPRDGLAERFGPVLLDWMDRALGRCPDALALHTPGEHYRHRLDLLEELHVLPRLLALAERQIAGLCGWLAARGLGLLAAQWRLYHAGEAVTRVALGLLEPSRDPVRLAGLLRERWHDLALTGPVRALEIELLQSRVLAGHTQPLFRVASAGAGGGEGGHRLKELVELLRARLGADAVRGIVPVGEHRPERAWQVAEPGRATVTATEPAGPRPLWLLPEPRALECRNGLPWMDGTLHLPGAAERIEGGWWDGAPIARDYHLATRADGLRCWIFHDLRARGRWYLHGLFA